MGFIILLKYYWLDNHSLYNSKYPLVSTTIAPPNIDDMNDTESEDEHHDHDKHEDKEEKSPRKNSHEE